MIKFIVVLIVLKVSFAAVYFKPYLSLIRRYPNVFVFFGIPDVYAYPIEEPSISKTDSSTSCSPKDEGEFS